MRGHTPGSHVLQQKGPGAPSINFYFSPFSIFILLSLILKRGAEHVIWREKNCFEGFVFHSKDEKGKESTPPKILFENFKLTENLQE